ncbi:unnamed protein product [Caenorhabditis brenneri]
MSLLKKCVGLDPNFRKPLDIGLIWEGNYWDDQDVHDCCDVDWETCEILVRKISKALLLPTAPTDGGPKENEKVLILLPKIMQLPLTILAAYRAGMMSIVMDPLTFKTSFLQSILLAEQPKFVVTVDAFWQAQELIEVKSSIENLPEMNETQLLVIRHVAPNNGVPPPKRHYPARRPSYRTSLSLRDGKDWEWSTVMAGITVGEYSKDGWKWDHDDVIMKLVDEEEKIHTVRHGELLKSLDARKTGLETKIAEKNGPNIENIMVMDAPKDLETLTNFLIPWYMGKTMTLYEGPLSYPDSSRLAQVISKHNVNILLGSGTYSIPNPEYLKFFAVPSLKIMDMPNFPIVSSYFLNFQQ